MTVKKQLNDTNYVLQKSARSHPFVVHVDRMWHFYGDLSKDGVKDSSYTPTLPDNSLEPTGDDKLATMDVAKLDKPTSQGMSAAELACSSTARAGQAPSTDLQQL